MMSARGDHAVFDEPFSRHYYFGPHRRSSRFSEDMPESSPEELVDLIERAAQERPVFVKDMAYHAVDLLEPGLLERFRNCFLVRDPAATLRSLARRWPDFTDEEAGWDALGRAVDVVEKLGQPLVVLDADRLCRDPAGVVSAWCEAMGLPFVEEALTWDPGMRAEWDLWGDWHSSTASSTGFAPPTDPTPPPTEEEPRLLEAYRQALPVYHRLRAHAVDVSQR
jgi:Sulfotransferase domain